MNIAAPVRLLQSTLIEVPAVIGWLNPVVLLPASIFSGLTSAQIEALLAHELAHIRRCDYLVNLAQTMIETVLFYHPVVWWIGGKLREERENCCDDMALEAMQDRFVYVSALAQLEKQRAVSFALSASGGSLLNRINRLVAKGNEGTEAKTTPGFFPLLALVLISGCIAIPLAGQITPTEKSAEFSGKISQTANTAKTTRIQFLVLEIAESDY